jgi:SAM-dependent methyltransferase
MRPPAIDYAAFADLYDSCVRFEEDIPFFLEEARGTKGRVLELMAGTGRVSLPLLEAGVSLTCVDLFPEMLAELRGKLERRDLSAALVCADVRSLPLRPAFDLALLPFQAFSELVTEEDQSAALASIRSALAPGGRFLCTLHDPDMRRRWADGAEHAVGRFPSLSIGSEVELSVRMEYDPATRIVSGLQVFRIMDEHGGLLERREVPVRFALPTWGDLESRAVGAGFEVVGVYGDYDRSEYTENESPYLILDLRG